MGHSTVPPRETLLRQERQNLWSHGRILRRGNSSAQIGHSPGTEAAAISYRRFSFEKNKPVCVCVRNVVWTQKSKSGATQAKILISKPRRRSLRLHHVLKQPMDNIYLKSEQPFNASQSPDGNSAVYESRFWTQNSVLNKSFRATTVLLTYQL